MADKTVTVKPAAGNYTTLAGAIAGELVANADLTAMAGILTISISGDWSATTDSTVVVINGFTVNSSYYLIVSTDAANRAKASGVDTGRYRLRSAGQYILTISDD
jgi:hypothetical protein